MFSTLITQIVTLSAFLMSLPLISPAKSTNTPKVDQSNSANSTKSNEAPTTEKTVQINRAQILSPPTSTSGQLKNALSERKHREKVKEDTTTTTKRCPTLMENADDAECVVNALQKTYAQLSTLQGTFTQEYTYSVYQRTQVSQGKLFLKKPGKMRWDYASPVLKVFVSNGRSLWVYEPTKSQAYVKNMADFNMPVALQFLMGKGNLLESFTPKISKVLDEIVAIELTPIKASQQYKQLNITINRKSGLVAETTVIDPVNNTNRMVFQALQTNSNLPDSGFEFTPPDGVQILR